MLSGKLSGASHFQMNSLDIYIFKCRNWRHSKCWGDIWVSNRVYKIIEKIGISDNIPAVLHMCALICCNKLEKKSLNLMNYSFFWNKRAIRKPNALSDDFQPIPYYPSKQISGNCSLTFRFRVIWTWKYFRKWWKLEETKQNPLPQGG